MQSIHQATAVDDFGIKVAEDTDDGDPDANGGSSRRVQLRELQEERHACAAGLQAAKGELKKNHLPRSHRKRLKGDKNWNNHLCCDLEGWGCSWGRHKKVKCSEKILRENIEIFSALEETLLPTRIARSSTTCESS